MSHFLASIVYAGKRPFETRMWLVQVQLEARFVKSQIQKDLVLRVSFS
jgi:hypothetical protein